MTNHQHHPKESQDSIYGLCRVSTGKQVSKGHSLDAQQTAIERFCTERGFVLTEMFVDEAVSGGKRLVNRPAGKRMDAKLRKGDTVIVTKLDRAFRSTIDALTTTQEWERRGVSLIVLDHGGAAVDTSTPMGKLFILMLAGFAEFERDMARERTRTVIADRVSKGFAHGFVRFGYANVEGRLVPVPEQQRIVERMRSLRAKEWPYSAIASKLNEDGIPSPGGKLWQKQTVHSILKLQGDPQ